MLLPSALSCDAQTHSPFSKASTARKMLLSPPRPAGQSSSTLSTNLFPACSALQSLLANSLPLPKTTSRSVLRPLDSPIRFSAPSRTLTTKIQKQKRYPSQGSKARTSLHTPPPAPSRKRCRRDSTPDSSCNEEDKENTPTTPKRKRRCPPSLPMGLAEEDFDALQPSLPQQPHTPFQLRPDTNFITPSHSTPMLDLPTQSTAREASPWTPADDSALVSVILDKLQLRQSDWDACGRKLGRGKASIGERFRSLVGDDAAGGLRRGSGGLRRGSVQQMEFGPEIVG